MKINMQQKKRGACETDILRSCLFMHLSRNSQKMRFFQIYYNLKEDGYVLSFTVTCQMRLFHNSLRQFKVRNTSL